MLYSFGNLAIRHLGQWYSQDFILGGISLSFAQIFWNEIVINPIVRYVYGCP